MNELAAAEYVDLAVSLVLALIMFGIGLTLSAKDFTNIVRRPRAFFTALAGQMLGLPFIAFLLMMFAPLPAELKMGLIILSISPGGATSGFLTYLWKGNVALSLSLTSVNSFLTLFTIPAFVNLALRTFMGRESDLTLPFWETVQHIFLITVVPATIGLLVRKYRPLLADLLSKPAKYVMLALLFIVFCIKIFAGKSAGGSGLTLHDALVLTPWALLQNACCLFFGYNIMRWSGFAQPTRITAAMESGVQNTTLAFLIAGFLANQEMVKPALVYSIYSFWTACLFAYLSNKIVLKNQAEAKAAEVEAAEQEGVEFEELPKN